MKMKKILIEQTWVDWGEADDIMEYYANDAEIMVLSREDILKLSKEEMSLYIFYVSSNTVQAFFGNFLDTYDERFNKYYHRNIRKTATIEISTFPVFVKPIGNDKVFDGSIIKSASELHEIVPNDVTTVYTCDVVSITNPVRLLIGNKKLYGMGKEYPIDADVDVSLAFIDEIVNTTNDFLTVDIGIIGNQWVVIEINPCYSIDSWTIPLQDYFKFCEDAIKHMVT
jgi:hypothetical protein